MTDEINCEHGIAYISLCLDNLKILVCASLVNASYWILPPFIVLDIREYDLIPDDKDLKNNNINNYITECELKVDIISTNSICLRLYKKDFENGDDEGDEGIYIGFCIKQKELLKIAQIHLYVK